MRNGAQARGLPEQGFGWGTVMASPPVPPRRAPSPEDRLVPLPTGAAKDPPVPPSLAEGARRCVPVVFRLCWRRVLKVSGPFRWVSASQPGLAVQVLAPVRFVP